MGEASGLGTVVEAKAAMGFGLVYAQLPRPPNFFMTSWAG